MVAFGDCSQHRFDIEAGRIREELDGTLARLHSHPALRLGQLPRLIDEERPAVLHLAAHASFGGVHLVGEEGQETVAWEMLLDQILVAS